MEIAAASFLRTAAGYKIKYDRDRISRGPAMEMSTVLKIDR